MKRTKKDLIKLFDGQSKLEFELYKTFQGVDDEEALLSLGKSQGLQMAVDLLKNDDFYKDTFEFLTCFGVLKKD